MTEGTVSRLLGVPAAQHRRGLDRRTRFDDCGRDTERRGISRISRRTVRSSTSIRARTRRSGDVRSDAASPLAHRSSRARVRRRGEGRIRRCVSRTTLAHFATPCATAPSTRSHGPRAAHGGREVGRFSATAAVGFTGLEIASALTMPHCPTCRPSASSSCSRRTRAHLGRSRRLAGAGFSRRRDGFAERDWIVDPLSFAFEG